MATIVTRYIVGNTLGAGATVESVIVALLGCPTGATVWQTAAPGGGVIHHDIVRLRQGILVHSHYRSGTENIKVLEAVMGGIDSHISGTVNEGPRPGIDWTDLSALRAEHNVVEGISAALPFNQASSTTLQAATKKAFGHWHIFHRNHFNDSYPNDYWQLNWLQVDGVQEHNHVAYGGRCRQRTLPRNNIPGGITDLQGNTIDFEKDIWEALSIGLDGFMYNIVSDNIGAAEWNYMMASFDAGDNLAHTGFRIMPNIDCHLVTGADVANAITIINSLKNRPCIYLDGGVPVVSTFGGGHASWTQAIWQQFINGTGVKLAKIDLAFTTSNIPTNTIAGGVWGGGCPSDTNTSTNCNTTKAAGRYWVDPIRSQDMRPGSNAYWEARGSELARTMFARAMSNNSEWIQLTTWNDFLENSGFAPCTAAQYAYYDLCAYYIQWFKLGTAPTIVRDVIYYFHRIERLAVSYNSGLQTNGTIARLGSDPGIDVIEWCAFLTATSDIEVEVSGAVTTIPAQAAGVRSGRSVALPTSAAAGALKFRIKRSGVTIASVDSPFPVYSSVTYQDFTYRAGSSSRANAPVLRTEHSNPP